MSNHSTNAKLYQYMGVKHLSQLLSYNQFLMSRPLPPSQPSVKVNRQTMCACTTNEQKRQECPQALWVNKCVAMLVMCFLGHCHTVSPHSITTEDGERKWGERVGGGYFTSHQNFNEEVICAMVYLCRVMG